MSGGGDGGLDLKHQQPGKSTSGADTVIAPGRTTLVEGIAPPTPQLFEGVAPEWESIGAEETASHASGVLPHTKTTAAPKVQSGGPRSTSPP